MGSEGHQYQAAPVDSAAVCGHCGTAINPGFRTCPACGATYRKRTGALIQILQYAGAGAVLVGLLGVGSQTDPGRWQACAIIGAIAVVLALFLRWRSPARWYR
jgi:uncharacterized protein (DUF983 family)